MPAAVRGHHQEPRRDSEAQDGDKWIPEADAVEIQVCSFSEETLNLLVLVPQICEYVFGID